MLNISLLVTCAYLLNLVYKYMLQDAPLWFRQTMLVVFFIFAGWLTMFFGLRDYGNLGVIDLRVVPVIFGTLLFRKPSTLLSIGLGIALARYAINGITPQAVTGSINIMLLGILAAYLVFLYREKDWSYRRKALISILSINTLQHLGIASFGAAPGDYLTTVAPFTYPACLALSTFFVFIIHDFYKEQLRADQLKCMNAALRKKTKELQESKEELEEKAGQLVGASRYKSEFIANMSHELRTPLNSIIVLSQLIRENGGTSSIKEIGGYAELIHKSGNDLLQMITDILDLSKIEAGKMEIVWQPVVIEELIQIIGRQFQPLMDARNLGFAIRLEDRLADTLTTDFQKLYQILRNLVMNAVKFTEQGEVVLSVNHRRIDAEDWIEFCVSDTGIGIDPDKQRLIFDAFQQEEGALNRKYGGIGLGLSISLRLAQLLGGTLSLQSEKGKGSRFSLYLPHWGAEEARHEETQAKLRMA